MIRLKQLLTESVTINGVTLQAANEKSGGPIRASWDGNTVLYRVTMSSLTYDGPVGITAIWKSEKNYYVLTNVNQKEKIDLKDLNKLVDEIRENKSEIEINAGWGVILTFIKKS
jgi:hypothetical protein